MRYLALSFLLASATALSGCGGGERVGDSAAPSAAEEPATGDTSSAVTNEAAEATPAPQTSDEAIDAATPADAEAAPATEPPAEAAPETDDAAPQ